MKASPADVGDVLADLSETERELARQSERRWQRAHAR
jgi:hypothetical protein